MTAETMDQFDIVQLLEEAELTGPDGLWAAVLLKAMSDWHLYHPDKKEDLEKPATTRVRHRQTWHSADRWLFGPGSNDVTAINSFASVCQTLDRTPEAVRRYILNLDPD